MRSKFDLGCVLTFKNLRIFEIFPLKYNANRSGYEGGTYRLSSRRNIQSKLKGTKFLSSPYTEFTGLSIPFISSINREQVYK